jgi:hypothetical protein
MNNIKEACLAIALDCAADATIGLLCLAGLLVLAGGTLLKTIDKLIYPPGPG